MRSALLLFAIACLAEAQAPVRPSWIDVLPQRPGRVYALGVAPLVSGQGQAQALKQASQNGRVEVATRLKASVKGETSIRSSAAVQRQTGGPTTASARQQVAQDSKISTQATELPGLGVEETWVDLEGRTAYALACLDVTVAERELRSRFDAAQKGMAQEGAPSADARERVRAILRVKKGRDELGRLEELGTTLLGGGLDETLQAQIVDGRITVDHQLDALRASVSVGVKADRDLISASGADLVAMVRNAVEKQGLSWADSSPDFTLQVHLPGLRKGPNPRWWDYQSSPDFAVAVGVVELTLLDRAGARCGAGAIEAKGVGPSEFNADTALLKDCSQKLEGAFGRLLEALSH